MTYPENPPYAGGPDEVVPDGALSATGIEALAGKTEADFEEELFGSVTGKIDPLTELFSVVTETFLSVVDKIVEVFSGFVDLDAAINTLDELLQFFYNVADKAGILAALEDLYDVVNAVGGTFFTVLEDIVSWFGSVIDLPNIDGLDGFLAVLGQIIDFFAGILGDVRDGFLDTLKTVINWVMTFAGLENINSLDDFLDLIEDVVQFFGSILDLPAWTGALKTLIDGLLSVIDLPLWVSYLTTLINGILDIPVLSTFVANLKTFINGLSGIGNLSTWVSYLTTVINSLLDVPFIADFMTVLKTLVNGIGTQVGNVGVWVSTVVTFINGLVGTVNLGTFAAVLKQVIEFFMTIADGIRAGFLDTLETVVEALREVPLLSNFMNVLKTLVTGFSSGIADLGSWVNTVKTFIEGLVGTANLGTFAAVLKQVIEFFMTIADEVRGGFLSTLETVTEALREVPLLSDFMNVLKTLVTGFSSGIADLSSWVNTVKTFINGLVGTANLGTFAAVLKQVIEFFMTFAAGVLGPFLEALKTVVNTFSGLFVNGTLTDWLASIPQFGQELINTLWSAVNGGAEAIGKTIQDALEGVAGFATGLIRNITGDPNAFALGDIATWAGDVLTKGLSWEDLLEILGTIPSFMLGVLPIPAINFVNPELMGQGGFDTSTSLDPGSGWSWDSTQRYPTTATTGGSAKASGGATRNLYAKQSIPVAEGDKLVVTCYVKSSGSVSSNSIKLDVVEIRGDNTTVTRSIAARGASSSWVLLGNTAESPYVVGSGVTSIRVKLSTTTGVAAGASVWFDAISVKKVGLLDGNWVQGILQGAGTVAGDLQGIVDGIKSAIEEAATSGNPLSAIKTSIERIFGGLFGLAFMPLNTVLQPLLETAIPGLSGSKITDGEVSLDVLPVAGIGDELGTAITSGSGAKMSRRNTSIEKDALAGLRLFETNFFDTVDQISADITASTATGRFTVTHAGYYIVEIGFTTNSSPPGAGAFNVAPMVVLNGANINGAPRPYKVGGDALGSYTIFAGNTYGNWSRSAHDTFIVYLNAGDYVQAGYRNFLVASSTFFVGDTYGASTYFSISMLNRTAEG